MLLGCHVSLNGDNQFLGSVQEAVKYQANTFMVYTGAPQNTLRKPLGEMRIEEAHQLMSVHNIQKSDVIVHAPYIVNLANPDPLKRQFAVDFLSEEVRRTEALGSMILVLHPGAHLLEGTDIGIERVSEGLNKIIENTSSSQVIIALESMAGKGTEIGCNFNELSMILSKIIHKNRIGICLDTCHLYDSGYDIVNHFDDIIKEFDALIGLQYLKVFHINDSKNPISSHKDRHENIGKGFIGFETINRIVHHPFLNSIPKILETPYVLSQKYEKRSYPPYRFEIEMLRSQNFKDNFIEDLLLETE